MMTFSGGSMILKRGEGGGGAMISLRWILDSGGRGGDP